MKALIPHKDTLFALAKEQKRIIAALSSILCADDDRANARIYPSYPLWAFADDITQEMKSCTIRRCVIKDANIYFEIEAEPQDDCHQKAELKIIIATIHGCTEKTQEMLCGKLNELYAFPGDEGEKRLSLPLAMRVFRVADVQLNDNGWQMFDDKWIRCKN